MATMTRRQGYILCAGLFIHEFEENRGQVKKKLIKKNVTTSAFIAFFSFWQKHSTASGTAIFGRSSKCRKIKMSKFGMST
jgi:hypothetical protein